MSYCTETIEWITIEDGPPDSDGPYLTTRRGLQGGSVIRIEWWEILPYKGGKIGKWEEDPPLWGAGEGGARDGAYENEYPVVAWAEYPDGYVELNEEEEVS